MTQQRLEYIAQKIAEYQFIINKNPETSVEAKQSMQGIVDIVSQHKLSVEEFCIIDDLVQQKLFKMNFKN